MNLFSVPDTFYPTPPALAEKMVARIDLDKCSAILEPEAGTGNLIKALARRLAVKRDWNYRECSIDCLEKDEYLRQVLKYEFSEEHRRELQDKIKPYEDKRKYDHSSGGYTGLSPSEQQEWSNLNDQIVSVNQEIHIVGDDFLTFQTSKQYDVILMNPPFDDGDLHLLRALDLQRHGGEIMCLLNAETVRNPYTNSRKLLERRLRELGATIEYMKDAFQTSETERKTDVEVALVHVVIPQEGRKSFIFEQLEKAKEEQQPNFEPTDLSKPGDNVARLVEQFQFESTAILRLMDEYFSMRPYIYSDFDDVNKSNYPILELKFCGGHDVSKNKCLRKVRLKYWHAFFHNPKFTGMLTSNLREEFQRTVNEMADYDFTEFNIREVMREMQRRLVGGVESTIISVFDKMSEAHSWYPECQKNIHYFNGWKTNKAHMINKKVILPLNGAFAYSYVSKKHEDNFDKYKVFSVLSDVEKALNYLDMGETGEVDLEHTLTVAAESGITRNIACKYFSVTLYKKGTCHVTFHSQDIVDKLNIYGCRYKGWLPPSYGKVSYAKMSEEEKAVINEFQGQIAYQRVMAEPDRWIVDTSQALLTAGT